MKIKSKKTNSNNLINKKRNTQDQENYNNSLYDFFNIKRNRNKISIIFSFLNINEQLSLITLNSIIADCIKSKYDLPFKSMQFLNDIKIKKSKIESSYDSIHKKFTNIIDKKNIDEIEYYYIINILIKNINNNFIHFDKWQINTTESGDKINEYIKILTKFLSQITYLSNITHIKFSLPNLDNSSINEYIEKNNYK